jgi:putative pyruvate formate lyase activating enzyme
MAIASKQPGSFSPAVRRLWELMNPCVICPRNCRVNRSKGELGFCGIPALPVVSSIGPHFGEERVLVGAGGSGTIFFAGCNLGCVFCQNYDISHHRHGEPVTVENLAGFMLDLQSYGCHNINFVTPTHVAPAIAAAIEEGRKKGLRLPTVYNSGGYDSVGTLKLLDGYMDIYMPDMKFSDDSAAREIANASDYPEISFAAVKEMHRQVGDLLMNEAGLATRGLLVRHLVLPNKMAGSFKVIDFLTAEISPRTTINVMDQYRPCYKAASYIQINRSSTAGEVDEVRRYARDKGLNVLD